MHHLIIKILAALYLFFITHIFAMEPKPSVEFSNEVIYNILFQIREYRYILDNPDHNYQVLKELCHLKKLNRTWYAIVNEFLCKDFASMPHINSLMACVKTFAYTKYAETDLIDPFCYVTKNNISFIIFKSDTGEIVLTQNNHIDDIALSSRISTQHTQAITTLRPVTINNHEYIASVAHDNTVNIWNISNNRLINIDTITIIYQKNSNTQPGIITGKQSFLILNSEKQTIQIWDYIPYPDAHTPEHLILWCLLQYTTFHNTKITLTPHLKAIFDDLDPLIKEKINPYINTSFTNNLKSNCLIM